MNQFSIDVLLEFLYNKFATTFMFCLFGSFVKEYLTIKLFIGKQDSNSKKVGKSNPGKVVISAIFSTILMCACADYVNVELHIEVYAMISVVLGLWGLDILKALLNQKFLKIFFKNILKLITDPLIKSAVESSLETEAIEDKKQQKEKDENK